MPGAATILHADLDAFYAAVEVRDRPDLRGRPVAVGGGVILSATYEARACGVHAPIDGRTARQRCPQLVIVPPHFDRYVAASDRVMEILGRFTPLVEPISIDEAFLDVTGSTQLFGDPRDIATAIRAMVAAEVGLPISVGVATTKHLAKIASRVAKPDGLLVVPPGAEEAFLAPLPVGHLWGIGPVGEQRLARYGIRTIGELLEAEPGALATWLGEHHGRHIGERAANRDPRPVRAGAARAGSVGAQSAGAADDPDTRDLVLLGLAERVGYRMRRRGVAGGRITVSVRFSDRSRVSRSMVLPGPVAETTSLFRAAASLVRELVGERARGRGVTLLAISMDRLQNTSGLQLEIPLGVGPADAALRAGSEEHSRLRDLDTAADRARRRFGRDAIRRAALLRHRTEERSPAATIADMDPGTPPVA